RDLVLTLDLVLYTDEVIARRISQGLNWSQQHETSLRTAVQPLSDQIQALTRRVSELDNATQLIERHVIEGEIGTIQTVERLLNENGHDLRERED
ncbi:hypothetical protein, partial [Pseudomonas viridiflava]